MSGEKLSSADAIAKDIGRKCADDVSAAIKRNMHLMPDHRGKFLVAVYAAVTGIAAATGAFAATIGGGPEPDERMVDELWTSFFRPLALGQLPDLSASTPDKEKGAGQ